jgi:3-deoxy-7-phosphoheptulonate synthase
MARASVAAGADGVHIEVHTCPEQALSDGPQALLPEEYAEVMTGLAQLAEMFERVIPVASGGSARST